MSLVDIIKDALQGTRPKLIFEEEIVSLGSAFNVIGNFSEHIQKQYAGKPTTLVTSGGKYKVYVLPEKSEKRRKAYARLCERYGTKSVTYFNITYDDGKSPIEIPSAGPA